MRYVNRLIMVLVATLVLAACAGNTRTYVDPQFHRADWSSIHPIAHPIPVNVEVFFQVNGAAKPQVDRGLRTDVENTLRRSHVFTPATGDTARGTLTVTANDLANIAAARRKGRHAALSFGSAAETLTDNYVFDIAYQGRDGRAFQHRYKHRLISTLGNNAKAPKGMTPTTLANGFQQIVQDVVLNFIQDWQSTGNAAQGTPPPTY